MLQSVSLRLCARKTGPSKWTLNHGVYSKYWTTSHVQLVAHASLNAWQRQSFSHWIHIKYLSICGQSLGSLLAQELYILTRKGSQNRVLCHNQNSWLVKDFIQIVLCAQTHCGFKGDRSLQFWSVSRVNSCLYHSDITKWIT